MAIIVNDPGRSGYFAQALGQGLQALAQQRLQQLQQREQARGISLLTGKSMEESEQIAKTGPELLKSFLPQLLKNQQQEKNIRMIDELDNLGGQSSQQTTFPMQTLATPTAPQQIPLSADQSIGINNVVPQTAQQPIISKTKPQIQPRNLTELNPNISTRAAKIAVAMGSPIDRAIGIQQEERKMASKDRQFAIKTQMAETKQDRENVSEAGKNVEADLRNLNIQKNLVASGKLIGPKENAFIELVGKKLGMDETQIDAFKNGESQVFAKLSFPYFRNMKPTFGAKPTQYEAQILQKSIPSLYQTNEGKLVIIEMMMDDAKMARKTLRTQQQIIDENKGIPPLNLAEMRDERMEPYRAKRFEKLKRDISNIMVATAGPGMSAEAAFKEAQRTGVDPIVENENGVQFRSDGKKWIMEWS